MVFGLFRAKVERFCFQRVGIVRPLSAWSPWTESWQIDAMSLVGALRQQKHHKNPTIVKSHT